MLPDEEFTAALAAMRNRLGINEVHLTGGEPTLHPRLPELICAARDLGLTVAMTSNGENRRKSFTIDGTRLEIDQWPLIPSYLEIEADTGDDVRRVAALLGYGEGDLTGGEHDQDLPPLRLRPEYDPGTRFG